MTTAAARYLWHQRLAWLLIAYATGIGWVVSPAFIGRASVVAGILFWVLLLCAVVMVCVKDSALRGRPVPYSWRLSMLFTLPVAIFLVEWRARRWSGPAWIFAHGLILVFAAVLAQITYVVLTTVIGLR